MTDREWDLYIHGKDLSTGGPGAKYTYKFFYGDNKNLTLDTEATPGEITSRPDAVVEIIKKHDPSVSEGTIGAIEIYMKMGEFYPEEE